MIDSNKMRRNEAGSRAEPDIIGCSYLGYQIGYVRLASASLMDFCEYDHLAQDYYNELVEQSRVRLVAKVQRVESRAYPKHLLQV